MLKFIDPSSERGSLMLKNKTIPHFPNMPAGQNHNFSEEWFSKSCSCPDEHSFNIISLYPINLQIGPDSSTEIALKKEMNPILSDMTGTKYTVIVIGDIPVSPSQHVFGIQSITHQ
jgi:hypothetical protein